MNKTISILRWVMLLAAFPFLFFVVTNQPQNWLYNLSLSLLLMAYVAQLFYLWKSGHKKSVKQSLLLLGLLVLGMAIIVVLKGL